MDVIRTWNRTLMEQCGIISWKSCFINVALFYQCKHWNTTKNSLIIYPKQSCSGLLKQYQYYALRIEVSLCFASITPCTGWKRIKIILCINIHFNDKITQEKIWIKWPGFSSVQGIKAYVWAYAESSNALRGPAWSYSTNSYIYIQ